MDVYFRKIFCLIDDIELYCIVMKNSRNLYGMKTYP